MGIYYKEWIESKWKLFAGLIIFTALSLLNVVVYPWMQILINPEMARMMESMMRQMLPFIDMPALEPMFDSWNSYLFGSWISKTLYQIMTVYIIVAASPLFAGEESKGTLEFLWAKPISTLSIVSAKYFSSILAIILISIVSTFILFPASMIMGEAFNASLFALGLLQSIPGYILLYSIAFMISALFKDSIKAMVASAVIFGIISFPAYLPDFRHLSIFRFLQAFNLLEQESFLWFPVVVLLALSAILFVITYNIVNTKET